jgi:EAL domain-containing protein (putative c-di-GMP-specific phosphodiesterase class I)
VGPTVSDAGSPGPENPITPSAIRAALADPGGVTVEFQPIFDVRNHRTAGWEILTRFTHIPDASTGQWLTTAYAHDLGTSLEAHVLGRVLAACRLRPPGTFMTFDLTPAALGEPAIEKLVMSLGALHGLVIELTELTELTGQAGPANQADPHRRLCCRQTACNRLRHQGAKIAVNDPGTGHTELAEILALRPDIIKLDRSVVTRIDRDPAQQALVRFLGDFCGHLDAWVLVKGVERRSQLAALRDLGVPLAQGCFTGRPAPEPRPCPAKLTRKSLELPQRPGTISTLTRPVTLAWKDQPNPPGTAVLLDVHGRPASVTLPKDDGTSATTPAGMLVPPSLSLVETARRAMARPSETRFDPLVCIDRSGRVLGVVAVEDLVLALADARAAGPADSPGAQRMGQDTLRGRPPVPGSRTSAGMSHGYPR